MFCRYCGTQISDESLFCSNCGRPVDEHQNINDSTPKYKVTIFRESQMYLINPPVNISINGVKNLSICNGETLLVDLVKGNYTFEFSLHFRKRVVNLDLDKDTLITLGWNRLTGALNAIVS